MEMDSKQIDFSNPETVLRAFMTEMNCWEIEAWKLHNRLKDSEPGSLWVQTESSWQPIFEKLCTSKKRVYGEHRSFSKPPTYDPKSEEILDMSCEKPNRTVIKTERKQAWQQHFYYVLLKKNNKWLIDNKYYYDRNGKIVRVIL